MKKIRANIIQILCVLVGAGGMFMALAWSFFETTVHCKTDKKLKKKRWFQLSHAKVNHPRYKFEKEYEEGKAWCRAQALQDCYIRSADGLLLHAYYLPAACAKRYVLLAHGYKGSGFGDFAYTAEFLHEHHCNLLFIDQRCCGESEGEFITFGARESCDVQEWAYYLSERNVGRLPIYLYGMSMGAASVLIASGKNLPNEVKGMIADCGFFSMKAQLREIAVSWFHMKWPELLLFRLGLFCRVLGGFRMNEADTTRAMKSNRRPVLLFHGEKDTYVSPDNSKYNYAVCRAPKELVLIPQARHLCSAYEAPQLYRKKLLDFFASYDS